MPKKPARKASKATHDRGLQNVGLEFGWLQSLIGFNLRIAHEASARAYLQGRAYTAPYFAILALIYLNPGLTQVALGRAVSRDTSSLTSVLDDLCKRRLVTRERSAHDRRSYELRITDAGVEAMEKLKSRVNAHEQELDRLFTQKEKQALVQMLKKISLGLSK